MRNFYLFKLYLRELKKQKNRVRMTIMAIVWGTIAIVLLTGFGKGLKKQLMIADRGLGKNIAILWGGQTSKVYQGLPQGRIISLREEDVWAIKEAIPEIIRISPEYMTWSSTLKTGKNEYNISISGVYPDFEYMRSNFPEYKGRFINDPDIKQKRRVIFLGFRLKEKIFGKSNPVGKLVYINNLPFQVIGVLKYKLQNSNYAMPDADRAYIPATTFTSMFGDQIVDNVVYQLEDPTLHKYVEKRIYSVLSQRLKFAPDDKMALSIWDTMEDQKITVAIMTGLTLFLGFIGAMTLFIAGVGVANIVYISIKERTREIGIKMAIGAKPGDIMRQIIMESLFISFSGGILGIVISFLLIYTIRSIPSREEWFQYLGHPVFSWDIAVVTVVILSLIGFFAGYFPARKASRIQPTEALHYE